MPRHSTIVGHPHKQAMERQYLQGQAVDVIAKQYGVDYQCLYRHLTTNKSGMSRQMSQAMQTKANAEGSEMLQLFVDRVEGLITKLDDAIEDTEGKDYQVMVAAIHELRQCLESQFKMWFTGQQQGITPVYDQTLQDALVQQEFDESLTILTDRELEQLRHISDKLKNRGISDAIILEEAPKHLPLRTRTRKPGISEQPVNNNAGEQQEMPTNNQVVKPIPDQEIPYTRWPDHPLNPLRRTK